MNPTLAVVAGLALYSAVAAPLLALALLARAHPLPLGIIGAVPLAILFFHTGWIGRHSLASFDIRDIESAALSGGSECAQVMQVLTEAGVILDRPSPRRLIVAQHLWSEMPTAVREVVTACVDETRSAAGNGEPIEIIGR